MKTYVVGGAVRDGLLGLPVQDQDHVVVGATPKEMVALGYIPVGKDFPVFLHPSSHEEYALARTERKTAPGYRGFVFHASPDITLEQDLIRRDLTINAMARDDDGSIIDPFGGRQDIQDRIFRHVSEAFAEDPVRILRVARFAARFTDFAVAPETMLLMQRMVRQGEVDALVPERVWHELARGLMEARPSRMFQVLRECGALTRIFPELDKLWNVKLAMCSSVVEHGEMNVGQRILKTLDIAVDKGAPLTARFACVVHKLDACFSFAVPKNEETGKTSLTTAAQVCERFRVPNDCKELAIAMTREWENIHASTVLDAAGIVCLFARCDAFRKPVRFMELLVACECDAYAWQGGEREEYIARQLLEKALKIVNTVDVGAVARDAAGKGVDGPAIGEAILQARIDALEKALHGM